MCDLNERSLLFRCMVRGFVGIFTTSLGFARCFRKSFHSLEAISLPFRSQKEKRNIKKKIESHFLSLEIISQLFGSLEIIWQQNGNFTAHFLSLEHFRSGGWISRRMGIFAAHFATVKWAYGCCEVALMCQRVVSQLQNTLRYGGTAAKSKKFPHWLCAVRLQMAITS